MQQGSMAEACRGLKFMHALATVWRGGDSDTDVGCATWGLGIFKQSPFKTGISGGRWMLQRADACTST